MLSLDATPNYLFDVGPRLNTSARLQTSLRLPSRTRGKHRRLRELLDAEDEDRTVVQSRVEGDVL